MNGYDYGSPRLITISIYGEFVVYQDGKKKIHQYYGSVRVVRGFRTVSAQFSLEFRTNFCGRTKNQNGIPRWFYGHQRCFLLVAIVVRFKAVAIVHGFKVGKIITPIKATKQNKLNANTKLPIFIKFRSGRTISIISVKGCSVLYANTPM